MFTYQRYLGEDLYKTSYYNFVKFRVQYNSCSDADDVMISTSSLNRQLQPPPYSRRGYRSPPPPSEPNNSTAQNSSPHQSQGQTTRSSRGQAVNLNRDPTSSDPPPYPGALVIGATVRPTNTS